MGMFTSSAISIVLKYLPTPSSSIFPTLLSYSYGIYYCSLSLCYYPYGRRPYIVALRATSLPSYLVRTPSSSKPLIAINIAISLAIYRFYSALSPSIIKVIIASLFSVLLRVL